jgi:hypothetical protein
MTKWNRLLIGAGLVAAAAAGCDDGGESGNSRNDSGGGTSTGGNPSTGSTTSTGGGPSSGGSATTGGAEQGGAAGDGSGGAATVGGTGGVGATKGREIDGNCWALCAVASSDPDEDGWGWEDNASCVVVDSDPYDQGTSCDFVAGGTGGTGGTGGATGGTGGATGGTGGATGGTGGATGSTGGATGGTGGGVSIECADGCAVLSSPLSASNQHTRWQIYFPGDGVDASTERLTFRIYVAAGGPNGGFQYGFQNGQSLNWAGTYPWYNLGTAVGTWQDLTIDLTQFAPPDVGAGGEGGAPNTPASGPDSSHVAILNFWIESGDNSGPWANPTVVYVDSVKSSAGTINVEFGTGVTNLHADGSNLAGSVATHTTIDP